MYLSFFRPYITVLFIEGRSPTLVLLHEVWKQDE